MKKPIINGITISTSADVLEALSEQCGKEAVQGVCVFDDYATAVIGFTEDNRIAYSYDKMVEFLAERDGTDPDDAAEFINFNVISTLPYMEKPPVILYPPDGYEEEEAQPRDKYKANVIRQNLEKLAGDGYYCPVRLKGGAGDAISLDADALGILLAYYGGSKGLADCLTGQQKDDIYHRVWHGYVCNDIRSWIKGNSDGTEDFSLTEGQVSYAADQYVYHGKYDCTQSYWENIEGVVRLALEFCPVKTAGKEQ